MKKTITAIIAINIVLLGCSGESENKKSTLNPVVINLNKCDVNNLDFNYVAGQRPNGSELKNKRSEIVKKLNKSLQTNYSDIYALVKDYKVFFNGYGISISNFNNSFNKDKVVFIPSITNNTSIQELTKSLGKPKRVRKDYNELTNKSAVDKNSSISYSFDICSGKSNIEFVYDRSNNKLDFVSIQSSNL